MKSLSGQKRILVIEDNEYVRENLREILELANYTVIALEDGKVGLNFILQELPDLIVCDITMPQLDGLSLLKIVRSNPATTHIPVVMLTSKVAHQDIRKGMNLGADDYITKPYDNTELLEVVELRLQRSHLATTPPNAPSPLISKEIGSEALLRLAGKREKRTYPKRSIIFQEGDFPKMLFFIKSGQVKITKTNEEDKEFLVRVCKPGDFFGYISLILEESFLETATALEDTELFLIPKKDFLDLIHSNRHVADWFLRHLATYTKDNETNMLRLAYNSVRKRIADALLNFNKNNNNSNHIEIMREDLAGAAGTATETVVRTLRDFKKAGMIDIKGRTIVLLSPEELAALPN